MVNEFLHGRVVNIGEQLVPEEGIHPLVERVSTVVEGGLFERIAFAVGKRSLSQISACSLKVMFVVASMNICIKMIPSGSSFSADARSKRLPTTSFWKWKRSAP